MRELMARSEESVYLAVIDKAARCVTYVEGVESSQPIRYMAPLPALHKLMKEIATQASGICPGHA